MLTVYVTKLFNFLAPLRLCGENQMRLNSQLLFNFSTE